MAYYKSGGINVTSNSNVSINTASGSIASFNTNLSMPVLETKATINPVQNGTPWIDSNVINKEPYIKRNVVGTATRIGNRLYDKLVGGTVAWNQLFDVSNVVDNLQWASETVTSLGDNKYSITFSANETTRQFLFVYLAKAHKAIIGHKYFCNINYKITNGSLGGDENRIRFQNGNDIYQTVLSGANINPVIFSANDTFDFNRFAIFNTLNSNITSDTKIELQPILIDLTQMFGSTIADYIYSLEQTTAGAGVAWFKNLFPNDYYAYNAGELMSVKATAHVMKNASNQVIGNYALDSNLVLNGLFKLDANNKLYADGDIYESSGAVTRKYTLIDLGSLSYTRSSYGSIVERFRFSAVMPNDYKKPSTTAERQNFITPKFVCSNAPISAAIDEDNTICGYDNDEKIYIRCDSYTDTESFKTAMSGIYLLYPITPTTEQASPFTNPQVCDENGTEEYTDSRTIPIPVGHETYQANICPISGFDELNIQQTNANIWDEVWESGSLDSGTGLPIVDNTRIRSKNYITVKPNETVYIKSPNNVWGVRYYASDKSFISGTSITPNSTLTMPSNCYYFKFTVVNMATYNNDISINYPSTDTSYHAYSGTVYPVSWQTEAGTVYGGNLDLTTGVLTVTNVKYTLDGNTVENDIGLSISTGFTQISVVPYQAVGKGNETFLSNNFETVALANKGEGKIWNNNSTTSIRMFLGLPDTVTTKAEAITWFSNNPTDVIYELATPQTYQLTPVQINSLLGTNNIWHDGNGDTEVKYRKVNTQ